MAKRLKSIRLPRYLKAKHLKIGLGLGALWGLLSAVIFITAGTFGSENHPNRWLYETFQTSIDALWFRALFLPFILLAQDYPVAAVFASTPLGATIGLIIGVMTSTIDYLIRK
jgi:hypothetical protein